MRHPPRSGLLRVAAPAPCASGATGEHTCVRSVISAYDGTSLPFGTGPRELPRALYG